MTTYRKKGNVTAVQYNGSNDEEVLAFGGEQTHMGHTPDPDDKEYPHLSTPSGNVQIGEGDYLVKDGEDFMVMHAEDFDAVYEVA